MSKFLRLSLSLVGGCIGLLFVSVGSAAEEWPQFRGPDGQGHATASKLSTTWSETENIAWKTPLPGRGWSSPVISANEIWLTTAVESPLSDEEKQARLKANTGNQPLTLSGPLSLRAVCIHRQTGKLVHDLEVLAEPQPQPVHAMNSFASPTPVLEAGRLYCPFGAHGTACLDTATQKIVWTNRDLQIQHENGPGSSPVLWGVLVGGLFASPGDRVMIFGRFEAKRWQILLGVLVFSIFPVVRTLGQLVADFFATWGAVGAAILWARVYGAPQRPTRKAPPKRPGHLKLVRGGARGEEPPKVLH